MNAPIRIDNVTSRRRDPRAESRLQDDLNLYGGAESILHDLRNPLMAINSAAEMILDPNLPPSQIIRLARNICRASGSMQALSQEMLKMSGNRNNLFGMCSLRDMALAACESMSAKAEVCRASLDVAIGPEIELPVQRGRMERAFVNLIANAIEAMPDGGAVRIWAEFVAGSALVHVDDSGPGVAPAIRHKVFQPFVTEGKRNGVGLGLAIAQRTVVEHGGELMVGSAPGGGARFSLRLPGARMNRRECWNVDCAGQNAGNFSQDSPQAADEK